MTRFTPIATRTGPTEMRNAPRKLVLMQATIISADGPMRVQVKDITAAGARVQCRHPLKQGCDVLFKRGELFCAGRITWTKQGEAGLQFYREVD